MWVQFAIMGLIEWSQEMYNSTFCCHFHSPYLFFLHIMVFPTLKMCGANESRDPERQMIENKVKTEGILLTSSMQMFFVMMRNDHQLQ